MSDTITRRVDFFNDSLAWLLKEMKDYVGRTDDWVSAVLVYRAPDRWIGEIYEIIEDED